MNEHCQHVTAAGVGHLLESVFTSHYEYNQVTPSISQESFHLGNLIGEYLLEKTFQTRLRCIRTGKRKDHTREALDIFLDTPHAFTKQILIPKIDSMLPKGNRVMYSRKYKRLRIEHFSS